MSPDDPTTPPVSPWRRWWVLAQVIAIIGICAFFILPRDADEPTNPTSAAALPVTRDSSVRAAPDIPMGVSAQFETLMTDVRTLDSTISVDMRYRDTGNFTGAPLPGYEANRAFLRTEAATALARVQASLRPQGLGIRIYDSYRPVRATDAMVAWTVRVHRENLVTDGYISDRSRHNLGVAIDCTLIDLKSGKPLDMGTPFDTFSESAHTANATGVAAANRARFVDAMKREGFTNYDQEWWHFTYDVPPATLRRFDVVIK